MTSKSKVKGSKFERDIVHKFQKAGFKAKRAYASNGESLGCDKEVDVIVDTTFSVGDVDESTNEITPHFTKIQCKIRQKMPSYLAIAEGVDAVIFREDRGEEYILMRLDSFVTEYLW